MSYVLSGMEILLAALVVLLLPGYAWLAWFPAPRLDPLERLAKALALSISITALGGLGLYLLGWPVSVRWVFLFYAACFVLLVAGCWRCGFARPRREHLAGLIVVAGIVAWRYYQAHTLALPAGVDSVHHVLIVKKILEMGGIPMDLSPELPIPFFYQYSFHLLAALFSRMALLEPAQGVLWMGQILNAGVAVAIYRLAKAVWGDPRPAWVAMLLCAFAFQMPGLFVSWGSYPLLAGLVVLPVSMAQILDVEKRRKPWVVKERNLRSYLVRSSSYILLVAGVCLSHYLALAALALFMLVAFIIYVIECWWEGWRFILRGTLDLILPALTGAALALPWLWRVWVYGRRLANVGAGAGLLSASQDTWDNLLFLLGPLRNYILLDFAIMGMVLVLLRKDPGGRRLALWGLLLVGFSLPFGMQIGPLQNQQAAMILFIPGSILAAHLLIALGDQIGWFWTPQYGRLVTGMLTAGLLLWGLATTANIVEPETVLVSRADLEALDWVAGNTPAEARFLINTQETWPGSYHGVDGGYWLPALTGRHTILPPSLYRFGSREYIRQINDHAILENHLNGCGRDFWSLVSSAQVTYVYVKKGVGNLQPGMLEGCKGLEPVYQRDGVIIYVIHQNWAGPGG